MKEKIGTIYINTAIIFLSFIIVGQFLGFVKMEWKQNKDIEEIGANYWHCFSRDGRINYVVVYSREKPTYLPSPGNESTDYYCQEINVVDIASYKSR